MSVASSENWGMNVIATTSIFKLSDLFTKSTLLLFAFLTIRALVKFQRRAPETKNPGLTELEGDLMTSKTSKVIAPR